MKDAKPKRLRKNDQKENLQVRRHAFILPFWRPLGSTHSMDKKWEQILVNGRHRFEIGQKHDIPF